MRWIDVLNTNAQSRGIQNEVDKVTKAQGRRTLPRLAGAMMDSNDILECYRRIHGHLDRLTVRLSLVFFRKIAADSHKAECKPGYVEDSQ